MTTGRKLIERALRGALQERGWTPRGAGWFTRAVAPGALGVLAVGVASKHSAPGQATATIYVHLRDEQLEAEVAKLTDTPNEGYRTTTGTTSIGHLMPASRWHEWHIELDSAAAAAEEMARAVQDYAEPYLRTLASDPRMLLEAVESSPSYSAASGLARAVLLLRRQGSDAEATEFLLRRMSGLAARTDPAAAIERRVAGTLGGALTK
ncbi:hypothetical protein [Cellulomonas soli]|uniref:Uncharacterized protein n=1 Tax=Cellulomonas soli TaxID=931535 RepID=A0A512P9A8_9CELL|nr:hypothetical protein [Cellulomonas soli]NYI60276.1 hypothetical protein [Cellulomonas soli]GEP67788.1 hypothetical protein CSO01_05030 [Cellulomonas soli]